MALGTTAPVGSVTVPARAPVPADWASRDGTTANDRIAASEAANHKEDSVLDVIKYPVRTQKLNGLGIRRAANTTDRSVTSPTSSNGFYARLGASLVKDGSNLTGSLI